jgi:TetR/AcrR family transcriptional regulator, regulator of biofilm formation and stress response
LDSPIAPRYVSADHELVDIYGSSRLEPASGEIADLASGLGATVEDQAELLAFQYELLLEARRRPELLPHIRRM